jgi:hypothetical protein
MTQAVECLLCKHEGQSSNLSPTKKKQNKTENLKCLGQAQGLMSISLVTQEVDPGLRPVQFKRSQDSISINKSGTW